MWSRREHVLLRRSEYARTPPTGEAKRLGSIKQESIMVRDVIEAAIPLIVSAFVAVVFIGRIGGVV
jgi:hypothetical protein